MAKRIRAHGTRVPPKEYVFLIDENAFDSLNGIMELRSVE